jgi:predicted acetyltransferase
MTPRRVRAGEELAFAHAVTRGFHQDQTDEALQPWADRLGAEPGYRAWVVADGEEFVGNLGVFATDLSLPGGTPVPVTAVTAVGVAQSHRRRGLLRSLMHACFDEARELGEPVAALYASESAIYGRFGFGITAPGVAYRLPRVHARFRDPVDRGTVVPVAPADAIDAFRPVFETARERRAGVGRTDLQWWSSFRHDPPSDRDGASARRLVHVPGRGYAAYRVRGRWDGELPDGTVEVQDLVATDADAEAALWHHVCDIDLTTTIVARLRPPDEALPRLLIDPMRLGGGLSMPLYTRILDVPEVFRRRGYQRSGHLVFRVHDDVRDTGGTFLLEVTPEEASCAPTDASPDVELSMEALSSVWLGGVRATQLLDARQLVEVTAGSAAALDQLMAVERAPWTSFMF